MTDCCQKPKLKMYRKLLACENCGMVFGTKSNFRNSFYIGKNKEVASSLGPTPGILNLKLNSKSIKFQIS